MVFPTRPFRGSVPAIVTSSAKSTVRPVLTKITTIPKGARSRAWMGPSDLAEYTISADIRGAR